MHCTRYALHTRWLTGFLQMINPTHSIKSLIVTGTARCIFTSWFICLLRRMGVGNTMVLKIHGFVIRCCRHCGDTLLPVLTWQTVVIPTALISVKVVTKAIFQTILINECNSKTTYSPCQHYPQRAKINAIAPLINNWHTAPDACCTYCNLVVHLIEPILLYNAGFLYSRMIPHMTIVKLFIRAWDDFCIIRCNIWWIVWYSWC